MNWDGRIRANALHIPLADESVHMVVTSPPYFSLRSYLIPPTVWDGDPDCPHAFLIPKKVRRTGSTNGRGAQGSTLGGANNKSTLGPGLANDEDGASKLRTDHSSFCQCGAWLGHLGLELTVQDYVRHMVQVFREVRRVLRSDGVCFMNLGDSYAQTGGTGLQGATTQRRGRRNAVAQQKKEPQSPPPGFQAKDLMLIPHRCAIALQEDGWIVRNDIVWEKASAMPESVLDRCTRSHEYIFHLVKSQRYYWDVTAIAEPGSPDTHARYARGRSDSHKYSEGQQTITRTFEHMARVTPKSAPASSGIRNNESFSAAVKDVVATRNKRTVWRLNTASYSESHYAVYPPAIPETTILVGTSAHGVCANCGAPWVRQTEKIVAPGRGSGNKERKHRDLFGGNPDHSAHLGFGVPYVPNATVTTGWAAACACAADVVPATVLDIFAGSNTTGMVAERLGRRWIGLDLGYQDMQERRLQNVQRDLRLDTEAR